MNKARLRRTILPLWTAVIAILAVILYLRGDSKGVLTVDTPASFPITRASDSTSMNRRRAACSR